MVLSVRIQLEFAVSMLRLAVLNNAKAQDMDLATDRQPIDPTVACEPRERFLVSDYR